MYHSDNYSGLDTGIDIDRTGIKYHGTNGNNLLWRDGLYHDYYFDGPSAVFVD